MTHPSWCRSCEQTVAHQGHRSDCPLGRPGPGRCTACNWHIATQGHVEDCPLGARSWMAMQPDGTILHNPPPPPKDRLEQWMTQGPLSSVEHSRLLDAAEHRADERAARRERRRR